MLGPNTAGAFLHLMPLFGAALSVLLLGENIHLYHLAGALLIASGLILTNRARNR
jgi:drug/metabolite transporter (DMT)-like permease